MSETAAPPAVLSAPPPGHTVTANVQLEEIEKAVYARDHERASQLLLSALRLLKQGALFIGYAPDPRVQTMLYSRFAAATVTLFSDPAYNISPDGFNHFASEHAILDVVFRASIFETSDHMLPMLSANPSEGDRTKLQIPDGAMLVKFLLTYSLRSGFGLNFEETFQKNAQVMFALWAGMISPLLTVAVQAHERRELLLGLHGVFKDVNVPDGILATLSDAYMYSSYAVRRDKHEMKATVHRLFAAALLKRDVKLPGPSLMQRRRQERWRLGTDSETDRIATPAVKPTILICVEWFGHLHAMFRCYASIIRQLRDRFHLVGMCRASDIDEEGKAEFDEWREVPGDKLVLADLVRTIVSEVRPDIIYFPSLGMAMWWVILASVRLAPIQVMTLGHPASSRSPNMDYVICEEGSIGDPALFTERIVEMPLDSARYVMRPDGDTVPFDLPMEEHPDVLRIAVPAMLCKLNVPFMQTLRRIAEAPRARTVEFHFFINMIGVNLYQAAREIRDWFPSAVIHERTNYPPYMQALQRCHLHLCTFPFGGTNSNIDSMLLGIPVLTMEGDEPHERFDAMMIRRAGLPEYLVAKSQDTYVEVANRLLDDDGFRNDLSSTLRGTDLRGLFFGEPPPDRRTSFLDAMTTIYEQHEALQASAERIVRIPTRQA